MKKSVFFITAIVITIVLIIWATIAAIQGQYVKSIMLILFANQAAGFVSSFKITKDD
jgi:hypothetical protein